VGVTIWKEQEGEDERSGRKSMFSYRARMDASERTKHLMRQAPFSLYSSQPHRARMVTWALQATTHQWRSSGSSWRCTGQGEPPTTFI